MGASNGRGKGPLALVSRDEDAAFYAREVSKRGGGPVLVLGCANGRIAWELAESGAQVTGVDPSDVMIATAEERRHDESRGAADRLRFRVADLRSLRLNEKFMVVLAPQNAIGLMATLEDLDALFATVAKHLDPTGTFLLDATNPRPAELHRDPEELLPPYLEPRRPLFAPHLRDRRRGATKSSSAIRRLRVGQFYPAELDASLSRSKLEARERFGDFDLQPFDNQQPLQIVIVGHAHDPE